MSINYPGLRTELLWVFPDSDLTPASPDALKAMREEYPNLPQHYLDFVREVGWGRIGRMNFMLYSGPCDVADIFDAATAADIAHIMLIGDDFSGWHLGFDTRRQWQLVGLSSATLDVVPEPAKTLADFATGLIANMDEAES